jgi:hypothetical protein
MFPLSPSLPLRLPLARILGLFSRLHLLLKRWLQSLLRGRRGRWVLIGRLRLSLRLSRCLPTGLRSLIPWLRDLSRKWLSGNRRLTGSLALRLPMHGHTRHHRAA